VNFHASLLSNHHRGWDNRSLTSFAMTQGKRVGEGGGGGIIDFHSPFDPSLCMKDEPDNLAPQNPVRAADRTLVEANGNSFGVEQISMVFWNASLHTRGGLI
jgi:hypothetical protein